MADAAKINVGIESVIHEAVTKALQNIENEFGIRVTQVRAGWIDAGTVHDGTFRHTVSGIEIVSETGMR